MAISIARNSATTQHDLCDYNDQECKTIIAKGEEAGMTYGKGEESARVRTSK